MGDMEDSGGGPLLARQRRLRRERSSFDGPSFLLDVLFSLLAVLAINGMVLVAFLAFLWFLGTV